MTALLSCLAHLSVLGVDPGGLLKEGQGGLLGWIEIPVAFNVADLGD